MWSYSADTKLKIASAYYAYKYIQFVCLKFDFSFEWLCIDVNSKSWLATKISFLSDTPQVIFLKSC
jgi:hypothetical protein